MTGEPVPAGPEVTAAAVRASRHPRLRYRGLLLLALSAALGLFLEWLPDAARQALLHNLLTNRTLIGLLLFFSLLTLSLVWSAGQRLDAWVFLTFNVRGARPRWLDGAMWAATQLGNMAAAAVMAVGFFVAGWRRLAMDIVLGMLTLWLLVEFVKALTDRSRPYVLLSNARVIGWREPGLSFPSGHTAQSFFMGGLFASHFAPGVWGSLGLYGLAALVGLTRMYVGAHYPRDVLAGAILGQLWAVLIVVVSGQIPPPLS